MSYPNPLPPPDEVSRVEIGLSFSVKGKGRPRFDGRSGHCYMAASYVTNKRQIAWVLRSAMSLRPGFLDSNSVYSIQLVFYRKRRKPKSKADAAEMERSWPIGGLCPGKPDVDNALGTLMDAATSVVYGDDSQVASAWIERRWALEEGAFFRIIKHGPYAVEEEVGVE